jgi:nucleotide-binding universal stress UspA family protein
VESLGQSDLERRELRILVEQIKSDAGCVLVLGPRVAIRANDPDRRPLDELLALELYASLGEQAKEVPPSLRRAADHYYRRHQDRVDLEVTAQDFYAREASSTTEFHRDLAQLPFRLCISASPDNLMLAAFEETKIKRPQKGCYCFKRQGVARLYPLTPERPLVYYLFGHHGDRESLVLTEADLIDFLVAIVKGAPPVPDQVRSILRDHATSFLFLGFGFHNWYLRVLLKVMDVYGHRTKAIAFEDTEFFSHPDREQAVAFFSDDRRIDFRSLRWEPFARQLREAYEATLPQPTTEAISAPLSLGPNAPKAFISYASEDREAVKALAEKLEAHGVRIWRDQQDLRAGDKWNEVLLDVIKKKVNYVIVVQTSAMTTAISGVFHREIEAARSRDAEMGESDGQKLRFLLPVKIGDCARLSSLKDFHMIDVAEAEGVDLLVKSILEDWDKRAVLGTRTQGIA